MNIIVKWFICFHSFCWGHKCSKFHKCNKFHTCNKFHKCNKILSTNVMKTFYKCNEKIHKCNKKFSFTNVIKILSTNVWDLGCVGFFRLIWGSRFRINVFQAKKLKLKICYICGNFCISLVEIFLFLFLFLFLTSTAFFGVFHQSYWNYRWT